MATAIMKQKEVPEMDDVEQGTSHALGTAYRRLLLVSQSLYEGAA